MSNYSIFIIHNGNFAYQKKWMEYSCQELKLENPIFINKNLDFQTFLTFKKWDFYTKHFELKTPSTNDNLEWIYCFIQIYEYLLNNNIDKKNILILTSNLHLYRDFKDRITDIIHSPFDFDFINLCTDNIFGPYMWNLNRNVRIFKSLKTNENNKNENRQAWLINQSSLLKIINYLKENKEWFSQYSIFYIIQKYFDRLKVYSIPKHQICYPRT